MDESLEEYLEFAKDIAQYAGEVMLKYFRDNNGASYKGDKTIVTLADTEINTYLIKQVKENILIIQLMEKKNNLEKVTMYGYVILWMEQLCMLDIFQLPYFHLL